MSPNQGLTQLEESAMISLAEDFLNLTSRTTVEGLKECKEVKNTDQPHMH